jgi:hypothetical protein
MHHSDLEVTGWWASPVIAGAVGSLVGLRFVPGASWIDRVVNVLAGSAMAGYVGPFASEMLALNSPQAQSALGFGLGLFGISLAGGVMQAIKDIALAEIIRDWISRR